ncbi:hypothetical protein ACHAWF_005916 [Thalassiosira exigua]
MALPRFMEIVLALLEVKSKSAEWPTIENYTLRGDGFCMSASENYYSYDGIPGITTVEDCGRACSESYGSDEGFVGINFLPEDTAYAKAYGGAVCNCMKDLYGYGLITGANGCCDEVCYSYNDATVASPKEWPTIDDYTLKGDGFCMSASGSYYSYDGIANITTIEDCGRACSESYGSDADFVGINFLPGDAPMAVWYGDAV